MTGSLEDAFRDHGRAVNSGDLQAILSDYADDAVILTAQGPLEGKAGVETFLAQALSLLPQVQVSARQTVISGNALLVWWSAESPAGRIDDGVDSFVYENGLIKLQSASFTVQLNEPTDS
jgi:ketosteroid isomerase-like protein